MAPYRVILVLAVVVGLSGACSGDDDDTDTDTATANSDDQASELQWHECPEDVAEDQACVDAAEVEVPLDYDDPGAAASSSSWRGTLPTNPTSGSERCS